MLRCPPRAVLAALAALALAGAGCGGGGEDRDAYVDEVNAAQQRFADAVEGIGAGADDPRELERGVARLEGAVSDTADEIAAVDPPEGVQRGHAQLVDVLRGYERELDRAGERVGSGSASVRLDAAQDLVATTAKAQAEFNRAIERINRELRE